MSNPIDSLRVMMRGISHQDVLFGLAAAACTLVMGSLYLSSTVSGSHSALHGVPLDDTWIHLVYARSFAEHGRFYYNPGVQEAGMSSPFWVILLAASYKLGALFGWSPQWCAKGLSALCGWGAAIATRRLALALGASQMVSACAGLLVVLEPNLVYGQWSGMEAPLASLLLMLAVHAAVEQRHGVCGVILGLLVITRGEGVPIAVFIAATELVHRVFTRARGGRLRIEKSDFTTGVRLLLPGFVSGALWTLYNLRVSGRPLPNTYYSKHDPSLGLFPFENLRAIFMRYFAQVSFLRGPLVLVTCVLVIAAGVHFARRKQWRLFVLAFGVPSLYVYLNSTTLAFLRIPPGETWSYFWRRYFDVVLPLLMMVLAAGAGHLWRAASEARNRAGQAGVVVAIAVLVGGIVERHPTRIADYSWDTENIEDVSVKMGQWLATSLPRAAVIAVTDAGAMRFFAGPDQRVLDVLGLNCAPCIDLRWADRFRVYRPGYAVFFRPGIEDIGTYTELKSLRPVKRTMLGGAELVAAALKPGD